MPAADRSTDQRGRDQRVPLALAAASALLLLTGSTVVPTYDEPVVPMSDSLPTVSALASTSTPPTGTPSTATPSTVEPRSPANERSADVSVRSAALPTTRSEKRAEQTTPARLAIGDVDIDVPVRPVGVAQDGQMSIPDTVGAAGWYRYGPRPSDRVGTTVIAGHVDSRAEGLGPFASLAALHPGSTIVVTDRAGARSSYRITDLTRIGKHAADLTQVFDRSGRPRLQIITCAGAYDPRTGYHDYLIVTAVPV